MPFILNTHFLLSIHLLKKNHFRRASRMNKGKNRILETNFYSFFLVFTTVIGIAPLISPARERGRGNARKQKETGGTPKTPRQSDSNHKLSLYLLSRLTSNVRTTSISLQRIQWSPILAGASTEKKKNGTRNYSFLRPAPCVVLMRNQIQFAYCRLKPPLRQVLNAETAAFAAAFAASQNS